MDPSCVSQGHSAVSGRSGCHRAPPLAATRPGKASPVQPLSQVALAGCKFPKPPPADDLPPPRRNKAVPMTKRVPHTPQSAQSPPKVCPLPLREASPLFPHLPQLGVIRHNLFHAPHGKAYLQQGIIRHIQL